MQIINFDENRSWVKKDGDPLFDVTMGSFDSAEGL